MKHYEYIREASYNLAIAREIASYFCPPAIETGINEIITEIRDVLNCLTYEDYNTKKHIERINFFKKYVLNKITEYSTNEMDAYNNHATIISVHFSRLFEELAKATTNLELFTIIYNEQKGN